MVMNTSAMSVGAPLLPVASDEGGLDCGDVERDDLRRQVEQHLTEQGFVFSNGHILAPVPDDKDRLRGLHEAAVKDRRARSEAALMRHENDFLARMAPGDSVEVGNIVPALVPLSGSRSFDSRLWRWCSLHWSIPVSSGYGRRLRFLIVDRGHKDKVMGLVGLADPVFGMKSRDEWIGWNWERRRVALTNVMDAFVLGAVPPYDGLLGAKLSALLATSTEVKTAFHDRYGDRRTIISQRNPDASLTLITTTSALGRSSVYNRLRRPDRSLAFQPVGYTRGSGDFHLSGPISSTLTDYAKRNGLSERSQRHQRWPGYESGSPRSRRAVFDCAMSSLGFDPKALRLHGIRRQVFVAPLAVNATAFLRGQDLRPEWQDLPVEELSDWWLNRWAIPRASKDERWRGFLPESWRLWGKQ
jgi:hypothetical protein